MFGNNNQSSRESSRPSKNGMGSTSMNRFNVGTTIEGEVNSDGDIRIDGKVIGTITTKAKIVIGKTGVIEGDIFCQSANIEGKVLGTIKVNEFLWLEKGANIEGDIVTNKMVVEEGAVFNGSCNMGNKTVVLSANGTSSANGKANKAANLQKQAV